MLSYDPSMAIDAAYGLAYVDDSSAPRRLSIEDAPSSAQRLEVTGSEGGRCGGGGDTAAVAATAEREGSWRRGTRKLRTDVGVSSAVAETV